MSPERCAQGNSGRRAPRCLVAFSRALALACLAPDLDLHLDRTSMQAVADTMDRLVGARTISLPATTIGFGARRIGFDLAIMNRSVISL